MVGHDRDARLEGRIPENPQGGGVGVGKPMSMRTQSCVQSLHGGSASV